MGLTTTIDRVKRFWNGTGGFGTTGTWILQKTPAKNYRNLGGKLFSAIKDSEDQLLFTNG